MTDSRGATVADHLAQLEKNGVRVEESERPEIPYEGEQLWDFFWRLSMGRGSTGFGVSPFQFSEIEAWSRVNRVQLDPWEVDCLKAMDMAFLKIVNGDKDGR